MLTVVYGGTATTTTTTTPPPPPAFCPVALDKASLSVGSTEANWSINVTTAATCAWSATSDADWLVVKSTSPAVPQGNGYAKVRAVTNTVSSAKRTGHFFVNGVVYTVTQGGCGTSCTGTTPTTPPPPPVQSVSTSTLKVLQYNTHHGGWGSDGVYSPDRIATWIVKSDADIVSLNEIESATAGPERISRCAQNLLARTGQTRYGVRRRQRLGYRHRQRRAVDVPDRRDRVLPAAGEPRRGGRDGLRQRADGELHLRAWTTCRVEPLKETAACCRG